MSTDPDDEVEIAQQIKEIEVRISESTDEHISARQTLDALVELVESEYEADEVSDEIRETIRQTYDENAQDTVRQYRDLDDDVAPETYCEAIENLEETLQSILNEPHARKLINGISSWLTSEGAGPLSESERDTLVENIKDDVTAATDHVGDLKKNWEQLGDEIPFSGQILDLIRTQILRVENPSDIRELALDVKNTAADLTYPITFASDGAFADDIESRTNQLIKSELESWINSCELFGDLDRKITGDWDTVHESVEDIKSSVDNILELTADISSSGIDESRVTEAINRFADPGSSATETPDSLRSLVDSIRANLKTIRQMTRQDVSQYQASEQEVPDRIVEQVKTINTKHDEAEEALGAALDAEELSTISENKSAFDKAIETAEKEMDALASKLKQRVTTIENLAEEFDATEQVGQARELLDEIPSMDELNEYIEGFKRYEEIRAEILREAREGLEGDENQLFELILERGGKMTIDTGDFEELNTEIDWEEERIGTTLMGLNQKGFINLDVRAF